MDINLVYRDASNGDDNAKDQLFRILNERFRLFTSQRVREEEDIRDIIQDTLMAIANSFNTKKIEHNFAAWAYRILRNRIYDHYQKSRRRQILEDSLGTDEPGYDDTNPKYVRLKSRLLKCLHFVHKSNKRHARILVLHYQGYRAEEICRRLGLSRNNYYIILHRARKLLEQCLTKGGSDNEELHG